MRLCTTRPPVPRAWTVELRSQPQGPLLVCAQCTLAPETLQARTARSAALAHLARHARRSLLPQHLRTCQCHEGGCRWHPRHRGCDGPLLLVLSREHGGRLWRLADTCVACARATKSACVIPDTALISAPCRRPLKRAPRRRPNSAHLESKARELVRDMLSYLAASLPHGIGPQARILALQCVLRARPDGHVHLPAGLIRGMKLPQPDADRQALVDCGWLRPSPRRNGSVLGQLADPLADGRGSRPRRQAADWALRVIQSRQLFHLSVAARLTALTLTASTPPGQTTGRGEADRLAHHCGLSPNELADTLQLLTAQRAITTWHLSPETLDLTWAAPIRIDGPASPTRCLP